MSTPFSGFAGFSAPEPPQAPPRELLDQLAEVIERRTMMQFAVERRAHLVKTVVARAKATGFSDATSYVRRVLGLGGETELLVLIDGLTINETTFFRNVPQLEMVTRVALPEIIARKRSAGAPKRIDIWSAACSTGQEPYTLVMLAFEATRFLPQWDVRVLGTDISPTVIDAARRAVYAKARLDTMPARYLRSYFDDHPDRIQVKDLLRRKVTFQQHNLRETFPQGQFDIIFCRNVMIYFSRDEQVRLAQRFKERLAPQGFLFIGHSETLQGMGVDYKLRISEGGVAYQRP